MWTHFPYDLGDEHAFERWMEGLISLRDGGKWFPYVVYSKKQEAYAGLTCYLSIDEPNQVIEVGGTWYGTAFHGTEVNPNCKLLMMTHAFETLGYQRVEYKTDVLNVRSRRAIEKLGAREEGILRSNRIVKGGRRRDTIYYSILKHEWPSVKANLGKRISTHL